MNSDSEYPMALHSPGTPLTVLDRELLSAGCAPSKESPRRRIIQPLHKEPGDILQRMLNTLQPGSYIRPHRHAPHRAESLVVLCGTLLYLTMERLIRPWCLRLVRERSVLILTAASGTASPRWNRIRCCSKSSRVLIMPGPTRNLPPGRPGNTAIRPQAI